MTENISDTISNSASRSAGHPELVEVLSQRMPVGRMQSTLLSVFERRSRDVMACDVLRRARSQDVVQASPIDQRALLQVDQVMLDAVDPTFLAVELSPMCTFGLNAALTNTNQKKIFTAARGTEVMSDLATALAVEAGARRATLLPLGAIRLCSSHRLARAQRYPAEFGFSPHFRIFSLVTADNQLFNAGDCMLDHIRQYLSFFNAANHAGWLIDGITITLADLSITERLMRFHDMDRLDVCSRTLPTDSRLFVEDAPFPALMDEPLQLHADIQRRYGIEANLERLSRIGEAVRATFSTHPSKISVRFALDRIGGLGHYEDLCFKIDGLNDSGRSYPLVDGGNTDWLQKMLSNRRERCFVSGIGTELFHRFYQPCAGTAPDASVL